MARRDRSIFSICIWLVVVTINIADLPEQGADVERWLTNKAFVYLGRLAPSKGIQVVLQCWLDLADAYPDVCPPLWIVGGSPEEIASIRRHTGFEAKLARHERISHIMWWGYLDPPGVSAILLRALVLVTHSHYEPGGRVILEAMRQGVPAIATPHGFAPDLIADWVSGFLVPYEDHSLLQQRMALFMHQPLLAKALGDQARVIASKALEHWEFFSHHYRVYDSVARKYPIEAPDPLASPGSYRSVLQQRRLSWQREETVVAASDNLVEWARSLLGQGTELKLQSVSGKSDSWIAIGPCGNLWIKQIHSHFRLTPIWLHKPGSRLHYTASQKWAAEIYNGANGVVCTLASNAQFRVIAMPVCSPIKITDDTVLQAQYLRTALDALAATPVPPTDMSLRLLVRQHTESNLDFDYLSAERDLCACPLNADAPSPLKLHASARLYLRMLLLMATQMRLVLPENMLQEFLALEPCMLALADREEYLPIVLLHHSATETHFGHLPDGQLVLVDKERLSYGYKGKDQAELITGLMIRDATASMKELLDSVVDSADERAVAQVWIGLHILSEAGLCTVRDHPDRASLVLSAWARWLGGLASNR